MVIMNFGNRFERYFRGQFTQCRQKVAYTPTSRCVSVS